MISNIVAMLNNFLDQNILSYIRLWQEYPIKLITAILDITIVIFLVYELIRIVKDYIIKLHRFSNNIVKNGKEKYRRIFLWQTIALTIQ